MNADPLYIAIDVGAGLGAKIGLFSSPLNQFGEGILRVRSLPTTSRISWRGCWNESSKCCGKAAGG